LEITKCANLFKIGHELSKFDKSVKDRSFKLHQKSLTAIAHNMQETGLKLTGLIGSSTNKQMPGVLGQIMVINSLFGEDSTIELYSNANIKIICDVSSVVESYSLKIVDLLEVEILNGDEAGNYSLNEFISHDELLTFERFEQILE
jgi:hypothetical protein